MNSRLINWIWEIRGSLALAPKQSSDEVFERLDPFFQEKGTTYERSGNTLVFHKKGQHAQDKMSVFDGGVLQVDNGPGQPVLRYHMTSRALLYCFLAPLLFLGFAQFTIALGNMEKPETEAAEKSEKEEDPAEKYAAIPMNPIDKFLGAPAPEKPKKDEKDKDKEDDKKPSPTPAYVFAGLFAVLYVVGRVLEDRLIKARFRKKLLGA